MIKLLKKNSLTVKDVFMAERFQLELSERNSTCTITVGPTAPEIGVSDWLQDEDAPGNDIVWRVKSVETDYGTETRTIQCEHVIQCLKELIMFGEVKTEDMAGKKDATTCTAEQAFQYILKKQKDWELDYFGIKKSAEYHFNGDTLLDAMETVTSSLEDARWVYDMSRYPFGISVLKRQADVGCELRMDRNIRSLKKTVDKSRMYTRFYPIGKNNLKLDKKYVEKNVKAYGVISKTETDQHKATQEQLKEWAEERLRVHAEPAVTITVSGLDLSQATGEPLDRLNLNTVCRIPLPEFGTTITERIIKLSWSDKLADPESVTITLANNQEDVASIINEIKKSGGGGGRAQSQINEEDLTSITETNKEIQLKAGKDELIGLINITPESITISANRIDIDGIITALSAKTIGCANLNVQNNIDASGNISADGYIYAGSYIWADSVRVGSSTTGATWQETTVMTDVERSNTRYFVYAVNGNVGNLSTIVGSLVTDTSSTKIYYLGHS